MRALPYKKGALSRDEESVIAGREAVLDVAKAALREFQAATNPAAEVAALERAIEIVVAKKYSSLSVEDRTIIDFQIVHTATHLNCAFAPMRRDLETLDFESREQELTNRANNAEIALDMLRQGYRDSQQVTSRRRRPG